LKIKGFKGFKGFKNFQLVLILKSLNPEILKSLNKNKNIEFRKNIGKGFKAGIS
jgi:hypothetical protein